MSMFEEKNIAPMLIGADGDAFDEDEAVHRRRRTFSHR